MIGDSRYLRIRKLDNNTVITRKLQAQAVREAGVIKYISNTTGAPSGGGASGGTTATGSGVTGVAYAVVYGPYGDLATTTGTNAQPVISSASVAGGFVAGDVGNFILIASGTNWFPGVYTIVSVGGGNATINKPCGNTATLTVGTWEEYASSTSNIVETYIAGDASGVYLVDNPASTQLVIRYDPINNPLFLLECF